MSGEQRIRAVLFYLGVFIFFTGLPFILSSSLGYKFDRKSLKFTKTGLIVLKTQPQGANIYLDNTLLKDKTPATINELLPGRYNIRLELEDHYSYSSDAQVRGGNVTRLEKIILFPSRPDIKKLNKDTISSFFMDEPRGAIYYAREDETSIYKSDLDGGRFEKIASYLPISPPAKKWKLSPDRLKFFYFNAHQIGVVSLEQEKAPPGIKCFACVIDHPLSAIHDVFWHSDSFHIIIVTATKIEIQEAENSATPVTLVALNKKNGSTFYDSRTDTLYFLDSQKAEDGILYDNVYKLELATKLYPFQELIKLAPSFEKPESKQNAGAKTEK